MVIRYSLSNCQTSTGTRHQTPTSLANPPDTAMHSDWLSSLHCSDSDPVNPHMNQIPIFPLAVSETHDWCSQTLSGFTAPRGGYSYPPYREKQHHSSPPSLSLSLFSSISLPVFRLCYAVLLCFCLCPSEGFEATPSLLNPSPQVRLLSDNSTVKVDLSDPRWNEIIPEGVIYLDWFLYTLSFFFSWEHIIFYFHYLPL